MTARLQISLRGAVQGVGFRPFVYKLAVDLDLKGFVYNSPKGVFIEVEGDRKLLDLFLARLEKEKPALARISGLEFVHLDPLGYETFQIKKSVSSSDKSVFILPDIATCGDCLSELFDPGDRRFMYPFINCTNCGPRFSIIESLPYDRPNTSMKGFVLCDRCRREYEDPADRRFHAQPTACPECGPHIELWDRTGRIIAVKEDALEISCGLIDNGSIIAVKGIGGYQLIADCRDDNTVKLLRRRKNREEKPFALMFPDIEAVKQVCSVSVYEERLLNSPESPIVLLGRSSFDTDIIGNAVAPDNPYMGVMLPYSPLHHILMKKLNHPVVATSGNLSEEPMCINEEEALEKLSGIADYFLVHNRPIVRHVDDSIVRIVFDREMVTRRARGYAPYPLTVNDRNVGTGLPLLAVGGHLKNTVALRVGANVFISQHIGDLSTEESLNAFNFTIDDFKKLYDIGAVRYVCDLHPDYLSTRYVMDNSNDYSVVQHHFAHIAACLSENQIFSRALGVSWDGTGYGTDGTVWGGEFFVSEGDKYSHIGQFRKFPLPGGEAAIKESRRAALGLLYEIYGTDLFKEGYSDLTKKFSGSELALLKNMLIKKINSPATSSAGRLFDAVSSILNISQISNYEGQSAMRLEFCADENTEDAYDFKIAQENILTVDWEPLIRNILDDISTGVKNEIISGKFHNSLARIILETAKITGETRVILSGGCFQNVLLIKKTVNLLGANGCTAYLHQRVPPNDGGISFGQIAAVGMKQVDSNLMLKQN